jgi:phosphatidylglycerol:prolipoprotein diacylglycerol transferase
MQIFAKHSSLWPNSLSPINPSAVEDLMTYMILGIILGGRIGYVVFYQPGYYLQNPTDIFKVWNGGMSFHGGFLGVVLGGLLYGRSKKTNLLSLGDLIAVASPPGLFFGRVANFINGELWGKPTNSSWGIAFPAKDAKICPSNWVGECTRHPSQLYEAVSEGLLIWAVIIICVLWFKSFKRRGEAMFIFLIGYGISRAIIELFREPDIQFISNINPNGYMIFISDNIGLSMGQILCLPMIIVGAASLFLTRYLRRKNN